MSKEKMTDEDMEREIELLQNDPFVLLAQRMDAVRSQRRQYLTTLREQHEAGRRLAAAGITMERLEDWGEA